MPWIHEPTEKNFNSYLTITPTFRNELHTAVTQHNRAPFGGPVELYLAAVIILLLLALSDLVVGVSNDAVNFLNSSIGSRVAPRHVIMIVACVGMIAGVMFSSGMMEVARKGIFNPGFFSLHEVMVIFLAVMITDILLLDVYNTFGLPTSTTVSIVFELIGASVAVSMIKIAAEDGSFAEIGKYINTGKALMIIAGILISVAIAFFFGTLVQFVTRLIFTFDYHRRLKRYGALWGAACLSLIIYFILIKGARGAAFIPPETMAWIHANTLRLLLGCYLVSALALQAVLLLTGYNILKPIVLIGTFALAMAFAANDLVNFIGVPLAGLSAYQIAAASEAPLGITMEALGEPMRTNSWLLVTAGIIMAVTLWFSRKARTVSQTEVGLSRQVEGLERFGSSPLSRSIVRLTSTIFSGLRAMVPGPVLAAISRRLDSSLYNPKDHSPGKGGAPSFDLLRASVNLMVASALISFATSLKLPLSTTYVTFMVAMGTSLADQAWGRESASYRVAGVLTVIGGWFVTAFMAFTVSGLFAAAIFYSKGYATLLLLAGALFVIARNHRSHRKRELEERELQVFNLENVNDIDDTVKVIFEHCGHLLREVKATSNECFRGLFSNDLGILRGLRKSNKKIQTWANIITANIYKALRFMSREEVRHSQNYAQIITILQEIAESHRDIIMRTLDHFDNNHKGMLEVQVRELRDVIRCFNALLDHAISAFLKRGIVDIRAINAAQKRLEGLVEKYNLNQIMRIQNETSKTRLSILFYGIMGKTRKISSHTVELIKLFRDTFPL
ncbi:MAG: inorganic phosphate transporter [Spirochaetes bacterium]|nr:inorganic phosphate transporter [Spirochaetota bacterium]